MILMFRQKFGSFSLGDSDNCSHPSSLQDLFIQCLQSLGLHPDSIQHLVEVIQGHYRSSNEVILEDVCLFIHMMAYFSLFSSPMKFVVGAVSVLPLRTNEASVGDKINLKCEILEVKAKNILRETGVSCRSNVLVLSQLVEDKVVNV
ncbi:hypothetical protein Tsubulata_032908 [Turnera subulata]|uniref:Uncharacterized protein n=1 Tax=Turnera subulata TaxID=218843 RepID=A0A9Q0F2S1_9ROSI|nr:hypothetical protein Tsubulata_032908 [Turnera subulata]